MIRALGVAALLLVVIPQCAASERCAATTMHLMRHAEKAAVADPDPELSDVGQRRAAGLVAWFDGKPLAAIYSTHLRRTQQTALPLARARDLDLRVLPAAETARLLQRLRRRHCGEHVLVVGHSNTVPEIAVALGAAPFVIEDSEYGWVYTWRGGVAQVARERYGEAAAIVP